MDQQRAMRVAERAKKAEKDPIIFLKGPFNYFQFNKPSSSNRLYASLIASS